MTVGITELPPEGMQLGGVALAGDAERGTKTTEGLSLLFTTAGITVQGPQPQIERLLVWSGLDSANCREKVALPDGRNAAVMELTSGGQAIRFLLPLDTVTPGQAAYLDQALPAWLARYKGGTASATPPPPPAPSATGANTHEQGAPAAADGPAASPPATNGSTRRPAAATPPPPSATAPPGTGSFDAPPPPPRAPERQGVAADAPEASGGAPFITGTLPAPPPQPAPPAPAPPPPSASGPTPSGPAAPPLPPPPPAATVAATAAAGGTAAWTGAPSPATTGRDGPPADQAPGGDALAAGKPSRGWRKSKGGPPRSAPAEASGAVAPAWPLADPPSHPPVNPVPLTTVTLPPPPAEGSGAPGSPGAVVWQPPIDPTTGEALWDQVEAPSDSPPKRATGWRRGAKAGAIGAAGAAGAAGAVGVATTSGPELGTSPAEGGPPDTPDRRVAPAATGDTQAPRRNRPLITVLVIVLVVVLGGIAYFAVKRNHNSPTTTATTAVTSPSPAVAAAALAASVNLRIGDLPTGWGRAPALGQIPTPPVAPVPAQAQANQALAGCLGVSYQTVAGLFDNATLPGQTGAARSPTFQSGSNPNVLMYSLATVLGSTAQVQTLGVPFANPNFATCFGQYQSSLAAAAVPGATASVQSVALTAPAGVTAYGYLTTLTIPNQAGIVVGEAFLLGGRIETLLEPATNGSSVPSSDFTSAFDAVTTRMAAAVNQ